MHKFDIDALFGSIARQFWIERQRASATGGTNNIRIKGDGPEKAIREWIGSVIGTTFRVTEGHVVNANGSKSKQLDIIIVRNSASATLYGTRSDEPELVRAESVAAVGEVKASWYNHKEVLHSYKEMISEIDQLQQDLLVPNRARFGEIQGNTSVAEMTLPISGREWLNPCYNFLIALGTGQCDLQNLAIDLARLGISPQDASALLLDEQSGGAICMPMRTKKNGQQVTGVQCDFYRKANEVRQTNNWTTFQETVLSPVIAGGRLLHLFLSDLQLHLSNWSWEHPDPRRYVQLSPTMRRRHPAEKLRHKNV